MTVSKFIYLKLLMMMFWKLLYTQPVVYLIILLINFRTFNCYVEKDTEDFSSGKIKRRRTTSPSFKALEAWADYLNPEVDYNTTLWKIAHRSSTWSVHFNEYAKKLSKVFETARAKVNFAMIGACDGTSDNTIRELFLTNEHWRGVFVEPVSINVRDLITYLAEKNVSQRSHVIRAAATSKCKSPTIVIERPLYEEKMLANQTKKEVPHWLRRQIGSVLPSWRNHSRKEWTTETVRCVTADSILTEWGGGGLTGENSLVRSQRRSKRSRKRRPHVLKIDVEGHDYEVLMSFMDGTVKLSELPLLIDFEAKSIAKKYPKAKIAMEQRGYVVSPFGADGFALLTADVIRQGLRKGKDNADRPAAP